PLFALATFVGMLIFMEIGRRLGIRRGDNDSDGAHAGMGIVDGSVFALLGLLLGFSFYGAASRFDERRTQIVEEANDIGTAYLRLDLLAPDARPVLRNLFREYLASRLATYQAIPDISATTHYLVKSEELQQQIWREAVAATTAPGAHPSSAVVTLPAINQMIDITTTRTMAARMHPPAVIPALLFVLCLTCGAIAGYSTSASRRRPWPHSLAFALMTCLTVFVILDVEYPRIGFVRIDSHDQVLVDLLDSFK
ncbi:MAG: DUF4239 domain-containing protein, partial [Vicinamibacterales bacterium]